MASVSKVIHTDNQLHAGQFGKTAYTEWIRWKKGVSGNLTRLVRDPYGRLSSALPGEL
jgi:hypothetical protein